MKKINVLWIILDLIFLVIFNAVFFLVGGTDHLAAAWISYCFIHFAYLMLLITPLLIRSGKSIAVFGFSLYSISSVYFFIELVIGIVFIAFYPDNYKTALLVQLCAAGLYGILLVSNMIANEHTNEAEEKRQPQIEYVKSASAKVKKLLENVEDKELKKKVEQVYDALNSSPVKSHPKLEQIESQINMSINELEKAVLTGNKDSIISLSDSLLNAINERNHQLKLLN